MAKEDFTVTKGNESQLFQEIATSLRLIDALLHSLSGELGNHEISHNDAFHRMLAIQAVVQKAGWLADMGCNFTVAGDAEQWFGVKRLKLPSNGMEVAHG